MVAYQHRKKSMTFEGNQLISQLLSDSNLESFQLEKLSFYGSSDYSTDLMRKEEKKLLYKNGDLFSHKKSWFSLVGFGELKSSDRNCVAALADFTSSILKEEEMSLTILAEEKNL